MKKTKKALLAAIACSAVLAGSFGLAACGNKDDDGDTAHSHSWNEWTVAIQPTKTGKGKATRTCNNPNCDATAADKEYNDLPLLSSSDYEKGADTATCTTAGTQHYKYNKNGVQVEFDVATPVKADAHSYAEGVYVDIDPDGHYQVCEHNEAHTSEKVAHTPTDGVCTVCGYDPNHTHEFNTEAWEKDESGHWHPTTCGHSIKTEGFAQHDYDEWTELTPATTTTEGEETSTCTTCQYVAKRAIPKVPTAVEGGEEKAPEAITAGRYSVVITAEESEYSPGDFLVNEAYFKLSAGEEAKAYRVVCEKGWLTINEEPALEPVDVVLESGQSKVFSITTDSFDIVEGFTDTVIFSITEIDLPEAGTASRPIYVNKSGSYGKENVEVDERVYFRLDHNYLGGTNVSFTLGTHVELYQIYEYQLSEDNAEGDKVKAGTTIEVSDYYDVYLYAVNGDGDCFVDFKVNLVEGSKRNPLAAKIGTGDENVNTVSGETWFKLDTAGKYTITASMPAEDSGLTVELYADVNDYMSVDASYDGSPLVVTVSAGTPVYIKGGNNEWDSFTITIKEYTDADKGTVASEPIELTQAGDVTLGGGTRYYTYTAAKTGMATLTFAADGENRVIFYSCYDNTFDMYGSTVGRNKLSVNVTKDNTYYFIVVNDTNLTGTFKFAAGEFATHDYVITLTDGDENTALNFSDITVNLFERNDIEMTTPVTTGITTNGVVTFNDIDGSKNYKLVIEGLPATHGYYDYDMRIDSNIDETTNFAALVYRKKDYSFTVSLPEGASDGVSLVGIQVTFTNAANSSENYTATTNEQGVATITVLDPIYIFNDEANAAQFSVTYTLTDPLAELYAKPDDNIYVSASRSEYDSDTGESVEVSNRDAEVTLLANVTYTLTLTDGTDPLPEGTSVTVNGVTQTTDANGQVTITTTAGVYNITIGGGYMTTTTTTAEGGALAVVCEKGNASVTGNLNPMAAPQLSLGKTPFKGSNSSVTYGEFTSEEGGTYVITFAPSDPNNPAGIDNIELITGEKALKYFDGTYVKDGTVVTAFEVDDFDFYVISVTVVLGAGELIDIGICGSGLINITQQA